MKKVIFVFCVLFASLTKAQTAALRVVTLTPVQADFLTGKKYNDDSFFSPVAVSGTFVVSEKEVIELRDTLKFRNVTFVKSIPVTTVSVSTLTVPVGQ